MYINVWKNSGIRQILNSFIQNNMVAAWDLKNIFWEKIEKGEKRIKMEQKFLKLFLGYKL